MSRYTKEHYEDVARILAEEKHFQETSGRPEGLSASGSVLNLIHTFADLFATDNPQRCSICDQRKDSGSPCDDLSEHYFEGGFDREPFLTACGLEPTVTDEGDYCGLCGKPSPDGASHKECADREAYLADRRMD